MKYLPITLIVTLSASLFVALVINPVLASKYMKLEKKGEEESNSLIGKIIKPIHKITHLFGDTLLPITINFYEKQLTKVLGEDRDPNIKVNKRNWFGIGALFLFLIVYGTINSIPQIPSFIALIIGIILGVGVIFVFTNIRLKVLASSFLLLIIIINVYGMFGLGVEFFPAVDPERVFVNIESPTGTNIEMSNRFQKTLKLNYQSLQKLT